MRRIGMFCSIGAVAVLLALPATVGAAKKPGGKTVVAAEAAPPAVATAQLLRETPLRREPFADAETVSTLPANSSVQPLQRRGAWVQVRAGEAEGWVRLLSLRSSAVAASAGNTGLQQALNVARSGASGNAVATGVRGLSQEEISLAKPDPAELAKLTRYAADETLARSFAAGAPLASAEVPFLEKGDE